MHTRAALEQIAFWFERLCHYLLYTMLLYLSVAIASPAALIIGWLCYAFMTGTQVPVDEHLAWTFALCALLITLALTVLWARAWVASRWPHVLSGAPV